MKGCSLAGKKRTLLALFCAVLVTACGGGSEDGPTPFAPVINNLTIQPELICVGDVAKVRFTLVDPNQDVIQWTGRLSTEIHGQLNPSTGTETSGTTVTVAFEAAKSGRHQHNVVLTLTATDNGGLQAEPLQVDFFVFNC